MNIKVGLLGDGNSGGKEKEIGDNMIEVHYIHV
jgi:hypothetical protein